MKQRLILLLVGMITLSITCQSQESKKNNDDAPQLKSVNEIKSVFEMADVTYYKDIVNEPTNALEYKGDKKIAANMGVYLGDMLYAVTTDSKKEGYNSYGAAMELAKSVGVEKEFPKYILERYAADNVNSDSLLAVLDKVLDNSNKKLTDNDKSEFFAYLVMGNYVEKLYILSSLVKKTNKDIPEASNAMLKRSLLMALGNQAGHLEKMLTMLSKHPNMTTEVIDVDEIRVLIQDYKNVADNREAIAKLEPAKIYKAKEIVAVQKQISKIRKRIVK